MVVIEAQFVLTKTLTYSNLVYKIFDPKVSVYTGKIRTLKATALISDCDREHESCDIIHASSIRKTVDMTSILNSKTTAEFMRHKCIGSRKSRM